MSNSKKKSQKKWLVVGNWKMNPTSWRAAKEIYLELKQSARRLQSSEVVIAPPALWLSPLAGYTRPDHFTFGGQNCHFVEAGSHTGEISPVMLKEAGADWVILGHSERRTDGESDERVADKAAAALRAGLRPIVCVGETERDEAGQYLSDLEKQVVRSVKTLSDKQLAKLVIAYEPVWAIGRKDNRALDGRAIQEMVIFIRRALTRRYNRQAAFSASILYGGSVTTQNVEDIVTYGQVDGLLVGRQSLEPAGFKELLDIVDNASPQI